MIAQMPPATKPLLQAASTLAPDGLPWPEGYFDRAPRVTIEESIRLHGIRPSRYWNGFPVYTTQDCESASYKSAYPPESEWLNDVEQASIDFGGSNRA